MPDTMENAPDVPGFELREVLGRAGVDSKWGVVYKAKEVKLNRLVALRIIRLRDHAGPAAAELLAQCRAVAALSHPNIVQVYLIGEDRGVVHIAMEFVAGGKLTEHWKNKPSPEETANLVEALADALHDARQHGIIHDGLDPTNILLTPDGSPKISYFGLARRVDETTGPAADVYALGTILYTGLADQTSEVLETSEVFLAPGTPRDLETICLKCLQKLPQGRYASAQELAAELRRVREGKPILARPAGMGKRLWQWLRRRPARAALIGTTLLAPILILFVLFQLPGKHGGEEKTPSPLSAPPSPLAPRPAPVLDLAAPFEQAAAIFPTWLPEGKEQLLLKPSPGKSALPLILSAIPCTRRVEMEAVLQHPNWSVAGPLGLVLNASAHGNQTVGYLFVLEVLAPVTAKNNDKPRQLTLAQALAQNLPVTMSIYRGGVRGKERLVQKQIPVAALLPAADETLRLRARRQGSSLFFTCNDAKVEFEDALPLTRKQTGLFALYLPAEVRVVSLKAWAQTSADPGPLDEADELYAADSFAEAIAKYQAVMQTTDDDEVRSAATYKTAICHLEHRDSDRAVAVLANLLRAPQPNMKDIGRWQVLAMCQLWALALKEGKENEADVIVDSLPRADFQRHFRFLPAHVYGQILAYYRWRPPGLGMIAPQRSGEIRDRELAVEVERLFQAPPGLQLRARFLLLRACVATGLKKKAHEQADVILKDAPAPNLANRSWWFDFWAEYSRLLQQDKQPRRALAEIDKRLFSAKSVLRMECLALLVERACLQAALGQDEQAENDLDDFFRHVKPGDFPVRFWTRAYLMRGLLHEARGDLPQAVKVWRAGLARKDGKVDWPLWSGDNGLAPLYHQLILAHLCAELSNDDVAALRDLLLKSLGGSIEAQAFTAGLRLMPEFTPEQLGLVLQRALASPDGRLLIRRLAQGELTDPELFEESLILSSLYLGKRFLEPHKLSAAEDALFKKLCQDLYGDALAGKVTRPQLMKAGQPLFLLWTFSLGSSSDFDRALQVFEPPLRGPIAYIFGLRFLHVLRNPSRAAEFFQRARDLAAEGAPLRALAAAEVARLKKK